MAGRKPGARPGPRPGPARARAAGEGAAQPLVIAAQAEAALSPEQRRYRQLQQRIDKARAELLAWDGHAPVFAQAYQARMLPLMGEMAVLRLQMVRRLDALLAAKGGWNKPDRRTIRRALCELALDVMDHEGLDDATRAELKALHDRHAEVSLEAVRQEQLQDVKDMLEDITGLDLGDEPFGSEEELRERAQRLMHERLVRQASSANTGEDGEPFASPASGAGAERRASARATATQRRQQQQAEEASQSVREVFRKLVSALHPDRADDEADRERRTALMQRANQAYTANDLLALLKLQLELEQVDAEHVARASSRHLQHINRVLAEQLEELQDEVCNRSEAFSLEFGIEPWIKLNPRKLGPLLEQQVRELREALLRTGSELRRLDDPVQARRWVAQARREQRMLDDDPFDIPF